VRSELRGEARRDLGREIDLLLAVGSPHCRGPVGRLARHDTRRCCLCHFSIEDAIDPALSAIWFDRAPI
jgi:hypothetical protein